MNPSKKYFGLICTEEKRIGHVDVKASQIHFYVKRKNSFNAKNAIPDFEEVRLNIGGAMNPKTGIFTAPRDGLYHFTFAANGNALDIHLQHNENNVAHGITDYYTHTSIHSTLELKKGDTVNLKVVKGTLFDPASNLSFFAGWLVEDENLFKNH